MENSDAKHGRVSVRKINRKSKITERIYTNRQHHPYESD